MPHGLHWELKREAITLKPFSYHTNLLLQFCAKPYTIPPARVISFPLDRGGFARDIDQAIYARKPASRGAARLEKGWCILFTFRGSCYIRNFPIPLSFKVTSVHHDLSMLQGTLVRLSLATKPANFAPVSNAPVTRCTVSERGHPGNNGILPPFYSRRGSISLG